MTENSGQWERELVTRLAMAAVREQRRARLWGIFFKLLTFAYLTLVLLLAVDWKGGADVVRGKKHTAMVELNRSEEHTSELQSLTNLVCRLLLEKKNKRRHARGHIG